MKHFFEQTEFGKSCWACGLFDYVAVSEPNCSQKHVSIKIHKLDKEIQELQEFKSKVLDALEKAKE